MIPQFEVLQLLESTERELWQQRWQRDAAHGLTRREAAPERHASGRGTLRSLQAIVGRLLT